MSTDKQTLFGSLNHTTAVKQLINHFLTSGCDQPKRFLRHLAQPDLAGNSNLLCFIG